MPPQQGLGSPRSGMSFPVGPPIYSPLPRPAPLPSLSHPHPHGLLYHGDLSRAESPTLTLRPLTEDGEGLMTPGLASAASSDQGGDSVAPSRVGMRAEALTPAAAGSTGSFSHPGSFSHQARGPMIPSLNLGLHPPPPSQGLSPLGILSPHTSSADLLTPKGFNPLNAGTWEGGAEGAGTSDPLPEAPEEIPMFVSSTGKRWQQQLKQRANLDPLPASAFITGVDITSGGGANSSSSPTPRLPLIDNNQSSALTAPLPLLSNEQQAIEEETKAELEALRSMWCSDPYSSSPGLNDQGALIISQVISNAEEEAWLEYERSADKFAEELVMALSRQDEMRQAQSLKARSSHKDRVGRVGAGGTSQEDYSSLEPQPNPNPARQMMETLSKEGLRMADTMDPEMLTGLGLGGYDEPLYELMGRLMVAPSVTKFLFFNKVQGLVSLARRMVEDRELARQMNELVWSAGLAIEDLEPVPDSPWDHPSKVGRAGGQGGASKRHDLPPAIRRRAQPPVPQGVTHQRAQAWPEASTPLVTTHRIVPPPRLVAKQAASISASASPSAANTPRTQHEASKPREILMDDADRKKIEAELRHEALQGRFEELMETRRLMAQAVRDASHMPPDQAIGSYYDVAPTAEEEAEVIDSLASVTVALHQDVLARARARAKAELSSQSTNPSGGNGVAPYSAWGAPSSTSLTANGMHYNQISSGQGLRIVARNAKEVMEMTGAVSSGPGGPIAVTLRDDQERKGKRTAVKIPAPLG